MGAVLRSADAKEGRWPSRRKDSLSGKLSRETNMKRLVFEEEHEQLRATARQFIEKECAPHAEKWESERLVDRESYVAAGKYGLIGFNLPEKFGGGGVDDFRFNAVIVEEFSRYGAATPGLEPAERYRRPVLRQPGQRGAAGALAARLHHR